MIVGILIISLLARIWYTLQPILLWWDASMYIGWGKYVFSGGFVGMVELFRPPALGVVLGVLWKLGLDPIVVGKIIALLSSLAALYLVYLIGEKIQKYAGVYAAALLSFSAVFFAYSAAPLSDIPAVTLALLALYTYLNKKYYMSGIWTGLAFLTRFPFALMPIVLILSAFFLREDKIKERVLKSIWIVLGFSTLAVPYFIINIFLYSDPFLPLTLGSQIAEHAAKFYDPHTFLFYLNGLFIQNPFILFSLVPIILLFIPKEKNIRIFLIPLIVSVIGIGGYFSFNPHQELRYGISFLPFVCILAGFGITYCTSRIPFKYTHYIGVTLVSVCLIWICIEAYKIYKDKYIETPQLHQFHTYFNDKKGTKIITTSPQMMAYSDIRIVDAFDTWEKALYLYSTRTPDIKYFGINDCAVMCENEATCPYAKKSFLEKISQEEIVFRETSRSCTLIIYKLK